MLSTIVIVVHELGAEKIVGSGTMRVEAGIRDDKVSVDKPIIVRNEFAQAEHETTSVMLSSTVTVVQGLDVEKALEDVEQGVVSVKVSKIVV